MVDLFKILAGTKDADTVFLKDAEVQSVDLKKRTCIVVFTTGKSANVVEVRLMAAVGDGLLFKPKIGSTVGLLVSKTVAPMIYQYSDIDEIIFRGGDLNGLVVIGKLTEKLNTLVSQQTAELVKIAAAITSLGGTYVSGTLSGFVQKDYENTKIKHG